MVRAIHDNVHIHCVVDVTDALRVDVTNPHHGCVACRATHGRVPAVHAHQTATHSLLDSFAPTPEHFAQIS